MRALLLAIAFAGAMAFACGGGGGGNFPDETPCPAAPPVATSRATPGTTSADAYVRRIQSFAVNLERLRADLRGTYPEDTFYRREEFRPDFAQYASQTVCTADAMLQMSAPDARFAEYEASARHRIAGPGRSHARGPRSREGSQRERLPGLVRRGRPKDRGGARGSVLGSAMTPLDFGAGSRGPPRPGIEHPASGTCRVTRPSALLSLAVHPAEHARPLRARHHRSFPPGRVARTPRRGPRSRSPSSRHARCPFVTSFEPVRCRCDTSATEPAKVSTGIKVIPKTQN